MGHPNTLEHYIGWFKVFLPEGKNSYRASYLVFGAHGESEIFTKPVGQTTVKVPSTGTIYACWCNIHGIWENTKELIRID